MYPQKHPELGLELACARNKTRRRENRQLPQGFRSVGLRREVSYQAGLPANRSLLINQEKTGRPGVGAVNTRVEARYLPPKLAANPWKVWRFVTCQASNHWRTVLALGYVPWWWDVDKSRKSSRVTLRRVDAIMSPAATRGRIVHGFAALSSHVVRAPAKGFVKESA
jgi:hypothetical protein